MQDNNVSPSPRIGNGLVWTVSVVEGNILFEAVGDIALEFSLELERPAIVWS